MAIQAVLEFEATGRSPDQGGRLLNWQEKQLIGPATTFEKSLPSSPLQILWKQITTAIFQCRLIKAYGASRVLAKAFALHDRYSSVMRTDFSVFLLMWKIRGL